MLNSLAAIYTGAGTPASTTAYESIATVTVGSGGSSTISFTSIPSGYSHLQLRGIAKGSSALAYGAITVNSDTAGNYSTHYLIGNGSTASADHDFNQITGPNQIVTSNGQFSAFVIDILDYGNTNKNKTFRSLNGYDANGSGYIDFLSGSWYSTSAITRLDIVGTTFQEFSQFALYGVK